MTIYDYIDSFETYDEMVADLNKMGIGPYVFSDEERDYICQLDENPDCE